MYLCLFVYICLYLYLFVYIWLYLFCASYIIMTHTAFLTNLEHLINATSEHDIIIKHVGQLDTLLNASADMSVSTHPTCYQPVLDMCTALMREHNIVFDTERNVDKLDMFIQQAFTPLQGIFTDIHIRDGILRQAKPIISATVGKNVNETLYVLVHYFAHVGDHPYMAHYADFVLKHKDDYEMAYRIFSSIEQLYTTPMYAITNPEFIEYVLCMALSTVRQKKILPTSSCYTRAHRGLYDYARAQLASNPGYKHPIDYILKLCLLDNTLSNTRRTELRRLITTRPGGANPPIYFISRSIPANKTNKELDIICSKLSEDAMDALEHALYAALKNNATMISVVLGGAPDTPLDILKSLLAAIKDDTQKLDAHYNALRQHLVQFAQRINQADVPYSAAPVDYSGLMEKYKELYRANNKLRGENQQLRGENKQLRDEPPLLVQQVAALSQDDALARVLKATYKRPQSRRDPNDSDAMTMMRAIRDIVESLSAPM